VFTQWFVLCNLCACLVKTWAHFDSSRAFLAQKTGQITSCVYAGLHSTVQSLLRTRRSWSTQGCVDVRSG
jgi:hypothetical protein